MLMLTYCRDGDDAFRLRATEFAAHAKHVSAIVERMRLGFPLCTKDADLVAGEASIVASVLCYEGESADACRGYASNDPYFQSGAWSQLEFYTAPRFSPATIVQGPGRHYAALLRRDGATEFGQTELGSIVAELKARSAFAMILECEGFSCGAAAEISVLRGMIVFRSDDLAAARELFAQALTKSGVNGEWSVLRIPRVTGSWLGVSPNAVINEQLAR